MIGVGLIALFWTLTLALQGSLTIGDGEAVAGVLALALVNAFLGMIVGVRLRGIVVRAVRVA